MAKRRGLLATAGLFVVVCTLGSASAMAQAVYGSIAGTVFDGSGAPIPNASVTVTNVERNTTTSVTTNESGNYAQTHLIIGHYTVRVEAPGFNVEVQQGVELAIDTVSTVDFHLKPGKVQETVQVTGEAPLLKTERTDVATTLSEKQVSDLPTFGRNFTELLLQTPGAVQFNWNDTSTENPQGGIAVNVNGQMFVGVGGQLDGTDNRDMMYGNMIIVPNLDSVVEAKITSSNYDAEFGSASAAVVTTSTKSGTNQFHGTAFLYRRNDVFPGQGPFHRVDPRPSYRAAAAAQPLGPVWRVDRRPDQQEQDLLFWGLPGDAGERWWFRNQRGPHRSGTHRRFQRMAARPQPAGHLQPLRRQREYHRPLPAPTFPGQCYPAAISLSAGYEFAEVHTAA